MATITLKAIKLENVKAVLNAIAGERQMTKLEVSKETGLSLMTVGKITSILSAEGLLARSKSTGQTAGRRAEIFKLRQDWLIPVFDLSTTNFKFFVATPKGEILDKVEYPCTTEPQYTTSEFIRFLSLTLDMLKKKYTKRHAIGIGVSICGVYNADSDQILSTMQPELASIKLMQNITKIFKQKNVIIENANRLCAAGVIESTENYRSRCIACLTVNESIECTVCENGIYLQGANGFAGKFGDLPYAPYFTYANFFRNAQSLRDITDPLADLLKTVVAAYDPDLIYFCTQKFAMTPNIFKTVEHAIFPATVWKNTKPVVKPVYTSENEILSAIAARVIENWVNNIVDSDT